MGIESQAGGFGAIYPVLREMEETGRIRRGHFVEGMTSAQLAAPGAVDRMRALRERPEKPEAVLLATTDPAQPYGVQLPWPATRLDSGKPRRAVGAYIVLVDGRPCLFVDRGGERILCFETDLGDGSDAVNAGDAEIRIARAARCLTRSLGRMGKSRVSVEEIDGERARRSSLVGIFTSAGFRAGYRGLEVDRVVETSTAHE